VIRSGLGMTLVASNRLDNKYSTITSGGSLQINGQANLTDASSVPQVNNVGQVLYATQTFTNTSYARAGYSKGSWTRPTVSEVVGDLKGIISGDQDVSVQGSINNVNHSNAQTSTNSGAVTLSLRPVVVIQGGNAT